MTERQTISKSLRFDIFKRDAFTCQYCGRRPPDVVLELDHIHPVSKGGDNDEMNLVTACFDCNRGKRDRVLQDYAPRPDADLAWLEMQQEIAELRRYNEAKVERDRAMETTLDALHSHWVDVLGKHYLLDDPTLAYWINVFGPQEVEYAINRALPKQQRGEFNHRQHCIRYVSAILWGRKRESDNG